MEHIQAIIASLLVMIALDAIWLSSQKSFYFYHFKNVQCNTPVSVRITPAVIAYILMCVGFVFFVVPLVNQQVKVQKNPFIVALKTGLPFGLVLYGIYNFTNHAVLKHYPATLAIMDTVWGTMLFTTITMVYAFLVLQLP